MDEVKQTTLAVLNAVHAVTDELQPPEIGKAVLVGVAAIMLAASMSDDEGPATWAARGFKWRTVRMQ